ncbi:MAG: UDP-glucose 4-epimerase GalE [Deltaproteobacteria bacterium]|nr:MAG: UDP-glucose 4-epimerase GalE [Deltaproteobacteria bacterium]
MPKVLVVGGAGYIGSHVAQALLAQSYEVVVFDNLSTGFREAVPGGATLVVGDLQHADQITGLLSQGFDAVLHFAAKVVVPESVVDPLTYYENNTVNTLRLARACLECGVLRIVFSSTAAVYGLGTVAVAEEAPLSPINPYGRSKLMSEWCLEDLSRASELRYVALRYFNVAGAALDGSNGQRTRGATHLVKVAAEAASGKREGVTLFGTDLPTPDGTGIRDYIHVEDLAHAHLLALEHLLDGGESEVVNCGYGRGASVREVLQTMRRVSGVDFPIVPGPPRVGDPPMLIAKADRIRVLWDFKPKYDDLEVICRTAWAWERRQRAAESS